MHRSTVAPLLALLLLLQPGANAESHKVHHGPREIWIIRHAEKPEDKEPKDPDLSPRGRERAEALATAIPAHFGRPDFLIAAKRSAHSNRSFETLEPLAKHLHLEIDARFSDAEFAALAHEVLTEPKYADKIILIAWHHGKIPDLARALGVANPPAAWDGKAFDRVWDVTFAE